MQIGVSTSCFYPMETMQALSVLQQANIGTAEIFLNTFSELSSEYLEKMRGQIKQGSTRICSLHPFTSGMETFFFASMYPQRLEDGLKLYRQYFSLCREFSIPRVVFHGDYVQTPYSFAKHCENFARLRDTAREYGVELCQENVVRCKCGTPKYIRKMREILQDDVHFVLDVKQLRRSGVQLSEMLDAMGGTVDHVHLSDETPLCDCAVPGTGTFDFSALFDALLRQGFTGDMVVELYRGDFTDVEQLQNAARHLQNLYEMRQNAAAST
ncbi:MAG: sugar phosphate isomerase/epimerase [Ruthenibacterium sp.]